MSFSFYWHDYETFGIDPALDRPCQFGGVRTDAELREIDEPLLLYCQPPSDYLPSPEACLITGITPQLARQRGLCEVDFAAAIHRELARPHTCGVGYNSLRFDDEFTRHLLFRNLYDPYAREWQNGNSRWDLIDVMRMAYALRPEGLAWPDDEGIPSFRLERLTAANGIAHQGAHDALVDVRATVELARRLRAAQPRLWDYALSLRIKDNVAGLLDVKTGQPVLHISARYPAAQGCAALVMPLARHPVNRNSVIVWNLMEDPRPLIEYQADRLRELLFTARDELPEGERRPALKEVHCNRSPMLATAKLLDVETSTRLGIDAAVCQAHAELLRGAPGLDTKLQAIFSENPWPQDSDPETRLYAGFVSNADRARLDKARRMTAQQLASATLVFDDSRLPEIVFRYRARNFPETLAPEDAEEWRQHCRSRLERGGPRKLLSLAQYRTQIAELRANHPASSTLFDALESYAGEIAAQPVPQ